ncbi:MAG TPA: HD domain-containing protein [Chloroflexia bacterium]|nr:HD domain-containing protein [Chloroflexia bacterium]
MCAVYQDPLWGEIDLREPVLVALVQSAPMLRLRGIHQAGASFYLYPERRATTRFEHSLGGLHLLVALGASLEEQVAGLLHDVPHTAFSHTVDILFQNAEHNFHEGFQHEIISNSEIPAILSRYEVPLVAALEPDSYPLLEQPLPDLCADRLDYSLRDLHALGRISSRDAVSFLSHLVPTPQGIWVDDVQAALWYAMLFKEVNDLLWAGSGDAGAYWALAGALRRAYQLGAFTDQDLFSTDDLAMQKLCALDDLIVAAYLHLLTPGTTFYEVADGGPYFAANMKQRHLDPWVLQDGDEQPQRLSRLSPEYARMLAAIPPGKSVHYKLWSDSVPPILAGSIEAQRV